MTRAAVWELQEVRELGSEQGQAGWECRIGQVESKRGGVKGGPLGG